ncbi:hypothetical protein [Kribbella pratensis]|nr:hypothetical protein [Kribbella pratensis]
MGLPSAALYVAALVAWGGVCGRDAAAEGTWPKPRSTLSRAEQVD